MHHTRDEYLVYVYFHFSVSCFVFKVVYMGPTSAFGCQSWECQQTDHQSPDLCDPWLADHHIQHACCHQHQQSHHHHHHHPHKGSFICGNSCQAMMLAWCKVMMVRWCKVMMVRWCKVMMVRRCKVMAHYTHGYHSAWVVLHMLKLIVIVIAIVSIIWCKKDTVLSLIKCGLATHKFEVHDQNLSCKFPKQLPYPDISVSPFLS